MHSCAIALLGCWSIVVLQCRSVAWCWDAAVLQYCGAGMLGCCSVEVLRCWSFAVLQH